MTSRECSWCGTPVNTKFREKKDLEDNTHYFHDGGGGPECWKEYQAWYTEYAEERVFIHNLFFALLPENKR